LAIAPGAEGMECPDKQCNPSAAMSRHLAILALAAALAACALTVRVVDGETIIAGTTHYRLWGIDAPGMHQVCADGWPAGMEARLALEALVSGRRIVCESRGYDPYRRIYGQCRADGQDLGAAMVTAGMAWASVSHSRAYVGIEQDARDEGRGLHAHDCSPPSDLDQSAMNIR